MKSRTHKTAALVLIPALVLSACNTLPKPVPRDPAFNKEGLRGLDDPAPADVAAAPAASIPSTPVVQRQQVLQGQQQFVRSPMRIGAPTVTAQGDISFNFEDQPIEAAINTILGDLLKVNYTIAPGVKGNVSFSTSRPVDKQQAFSILETLLSWNDAALIKRDDKYLVLPRDKAIAGNLAPQMPSTHLQPGLSVRIFPLKYISANEMQKLLQPYSLDKSVLQADSARNILVLAGTPDELDSYQRTIDTFDVNWLKGMSIGMYALEHASAKELIPQLKDMFGPGSATPLANLVKFIPVERTNSIVAISPQPDYLNDIGRWIQTIDSDGGNEPHLYTYRVLNMKASELAQYLQQIYGTSGGTAANQAADVAPGLTGVSMTSETSDPGQSGTSMAQSGTSSSPATSMAASSTGSMNTDNSQSTGGNSDSSNSADAASGSRQAGDIRIAAQISGNQLLVRARPSQWKEIQQAVQRIDTPPEQVQIETRILEVNLTGELEHGVQWYLGNLAGNSDSTTVSNTKGHQGALGTAGLGLASADSFYYSFVGSKVQVALHALETSSRTQVLSAPSLVVLNNQKARIQVGDEIPVTQTSINTTASTNTVSSVEYLQTGVILNVTPRINPDGRVYMDIGQQVSDASDSGSDSTNPTISTRTINTEISVQDGQTVLLGGLIKNNHGDSTSGVPLLGDIPGVGWLFKSRTKTNNRTELIVLIRPRIIRDHSDAARISQDYQRQMQLLQSE